MLRPLLTIALILNPLAAQAKPLARTADEAYANANAQGTGYLALNAAQHPQLVEAFAFADRVAHFCPVILTAKDPTSEMARWAELNRYSGDDTARMAIACRTWINGYASHKNK